MAQTQKRVLVALSGGLDSAVTAILLKKSGYSPIGITLRLFEKDENSLMVADEQYLYDAKRLAYNLGFPHYSIDYRQNFGAIVDYFVSDYLDGKTPNPCVQCNLQIKFKVFLQLAAQFGCDFVATGHYAKIEQVNDEFRLFEGADSVKDQSYFLWKLGQEHLAKVLFPLGGFTKPEVRQLAAKLGFRSFAEKKESYDVCFIRNQSYREFLAARVPKNHAAMQAGNFVDTAGKIVGQHSGIANYTIGQRKGLQIALGEPVYVKHINADSNTVVLGREHELYNEQFTVGGVNWIAGEVPDLNRRYRVKIRYKDGGQMATIEPFGADFRINLDKPSKAVTPGQSAVILSDNQVIGGGIINTILQ